MDSGWPSSVEDLRMKWDELRAIRLWTRPLRISIYTLWSMIPKRNREYGTRFVSSVSIYDLLRAPDFLLIKRNIEQYCLRSLKNRKWKLHQERHKGWLAMVRYIKYYSCIKLNIYVGYFGFRRHTSKLILLEDGEDGGEEEKQGKRDVI